MGDSSPDQSVPANGGSDIPIRNLWYMLLYVWDALHVKDRWHAEVEDSPSLDALLARVLVRQVERRLRIGMGRDYREEAAERPGIRGRVDFGESVRRMSLPHGRAFCRYCCFDVDVPRNQVIRSTMAHVAQIRTVRLKSE